MWQQGKHQSYLREVTEHSEIGSLCLSPRYIKYQSYIFIIIIMHFISGSMAHKNMASEKTDTN